MPSMTRRQFMQASGATIAAAAIASPLAAQATAPATTQSKKLNLAIIGTGGRGMDHVREVNVVPEANVIALCDVDAVMLVNACRHIAKAKPFVDFHDVLAMKDLEAVVIATPDHNHAAIAAAALRAGKHVYCEKPLAHTIKEIRAVTELAKETKLVTQLGIQIHSLDNYRRVVEIIKSDAIGKIDKVDIWNNRTHHALDNTEKPPPASLNYDLWLGPLKPRPYHAGFHPFNWRRYWSFGEGMLGDIGCHLMDVAFWALDLKYPTRIEAEGGGGDDVICPEWNIARLDFPARGDQPPVKLTWYDPPKRPPQFQSWKLDPEKHAEGVLFHGEGGMLYTNFTEHLLLPQEKFATFKPPPQSIPKSPGHQREWILACLKNDPAAATANFSYGGPLAESALIGLVAYRAGKPLDWDAANLKFPNAPEAEKFLDYDYRPGWTL